MRRLLIWIGMFVCLTIAARAQVIGLDPTPLAFYYWDTTTSAWHACPNNSTAEAYFDTPQAVAEHGFNGSLGQWTPMTTCPVTGAFVSQIIPGINISISPISGTGVVTINATGGATEIEVNGVKVDDPPNFNDSTPAAPTGRTNVTWQHDGSSVSASVPTASAANMFMQQVVPPVAGQYVIVYNTANTHYADGPMSSASSNTGGSIGVSFYVIASGTATITWSNPQLPSGLDPANVTSVYAFEVSDSKSDQIRNPPMHCINDDLTPNPGTTGMAISSGGLTLTPGGWWSTEQGTVLLPGATGANFSSQTIVASGGVSAPCKGPAHSDILLTGYIVYYSGTALPSTDNSIQVEIPLEYNSQDNTLSIDPWAEFPGTALVPGLIVDLPPAGYAIGWIASVTDPVDDNDCTVGGGTGHPHLCKSDGQWRLYTTGTIDASSLTGTTLATNVVNSSLTSVGTLTTLGVSGNATVGGTTTTGALKATGAASTSGEACLHIDDTGLITNTGSDCGSGGGGGGVQYNPTNTLYVWTGESTINDDTGVLGPTITLSSWSCASGTCTFTNTGTNGLVVGDWVDVQGATGWFVPAAPVAVASTGYGQFQVLSTGLSSTQFEISYALNTGSGTGGTVGVATYQLPYLMSTLPFFKNHGTVKKILDSNYYCANIDADFTTLFYADSPAATGNNPEYFILDGCKNDIAIGTSVADIETHMSSIMTKAHAIGYITMGQTMIPSPWDDATLQEHWRQVNVWWRGQGKSATNAASGAYWDRLADVGGKIIELRNLLYIAGNGGYGPGGVALAAQIYNDAMGVQGSAVSSLPSQIGVNNWGGINIVLPDDGYPAFSIYQQNSPTTLWASFSSQGNYLSGLNIGSGSGGGTGHLHITQADSGYDEGIQLTDPSLNAGNTITYPWGLHPYSHVGGNYEGVGFGFERLATVANSNLNAFGVRFDGMSADAFRLSDGAGLLIPVLKTTTGFNCLQVDATGNITNTGAACQPATLKSTTDPPTATCSSTVNNGTFATSITLGLYQCSNNNSSATYAWNVLASSSVAFTLTTTGTSGAATYSGGVLNIPQYTGGGASGITPVNITSQLTTTGCTMNGNNTACVVDSATSSVTFSSIPQTYTNLQVKITMEQSGTGDTQFQLSGDTSSDYQWIWQVGGSGGASGNYGHSCYISIAGNSGWPTSCYTDFPNYSNTSWKKMWFARAANGNAGDNVDNLYFTGWWNNTGAITSFSFYPTSGDTIAAGSVFQFIAE